MYKYKVAIRRTSQQHKASIFGIFWLIEYSYIRFKFMAGYGRFRKSRRISRSRGGMRRASSSRRRSGLKRVSRPRFATVGFARNVEKKYWDKSYQGTSTEARVGAPGADTASVGYMYISDAWQDHNFANQTGAAAAISNDFNKGLITGTTARTRIANKIRPVYYKGSWTFTAASVDKTVTSNNGENYGALVADVAQWNYLRTTYRMVIVKDLQVNSTDAQVNWQQVFETGTNLTAGVHSELNVDSMGRFIVLEDRFFTLDADTPQKTCPFHINGSKMGHIRYNGPSAAALTDKGIYMIYAAYVMGVGNTVGHPLIRLPGVVGNTRLCFTDA